ncbi:phosphoenolpyruvate-utilizing N-terminal domain-containing protein, partial [Microbacterium sp. GbtcB4]|uniref:phosphoenolpyruvate-utilizing N-terminal domain-containing protein n=1 Tax=Microbacterium sp. GbtcB4 TaxID=2824749 RepID=UPI0026733D77
MSALGGVGSGLGVAQGPVARMTEALPAPENPPSTAGADAERARAREAVAVVAQELTQRGEPAGGAAQEVLEAQAMIAE